MDVNDQVHATSQLESSLKLEKDSLNMLVYKLQQEVLTELDSKSLDNLVEMEKSRGDDQLDLDRDFGNHARGVKVDRELIHKILTAVKAQKRKLLITTGRVEVGLSLYLPCCSFNSTDSISSSCKEHWISLNDET